MPIGSIQRQIFKWLSYSLLLIIALSIDPASLRATITTPTPADLEIGLVSENPNYYYDRETAFMVAYAVDYIHGGVYMGVRPDGSPITDLSSEITNFWGIPSTVFAGNHIQGTEKSLFGLGTCVRYFIQEYQRTETLRLNRAGGVDGINAQLAVIGTSRRINRPSDLLTIAQSCADFVTRHMIIDRFDDGINENPFNAADPVNGWTAPAQLPDIGDVVNPDRVYYWTSVSRDATTRFVDDTLHLIAENAGAPRAESVVVYSIAELALVMQSNGIAGWQQYRDAADDWWRWRNNDGDTPLPLYNDPTPQDPNDPLDTNDQQNWDDCSNPRIPPGPGDPDPVNRCLAGGARDLFYPAVSYILNILNGNNNPSTGTYADGYTYGQSKVGVASPPIDDPLKDTGYIAGFARAIVYTNVQQRNISVGLNAQWANFGWFTVDNLTMNPNPSTPYSHFAGREWLAGTQRSLWFFHNYLSGRVGRTSNDPDMIVDEIIRHWNDSVTGMWDNVVGQEAWFESERQAYKPCFSAGTDLPIGDWLAPFIQDKTHEIDPVTNTVTVTIYDVQDEPFQYMSWQFDGIGVADDGVQVVYTLDETATNPADWEYVTAANMGDLDGNGIDDYQASINIDPLLADVTVDAVYYYARAIDRFANVSTFPNDVDEWTTAGELLSQQLRNAQIVNGPPPSGGGGGDDDSDDGTASGSNSLAFFKGATPAVASVGDNVTWTITVSNNTNGTQSNVSFVDNVPSELDIVSASATAGSVQIQGQQVLFEIDSLAAGQSVTITIVTTINASGGGTIIVNTVEGVAAEVISAQGLPATGETPNWYPCYWHDDCRWRDNRLLR